MKVALQKTHDQIESYDIHIKQYHQNNGKSLLVPALGLDTVSYQKKLHRRHRKFETCS